MGCGNAHPQQDHRTVMNIEGRTTRAASRRTGRHRADVRLGKRLRYGGVSGTLAPFSRHAARRATDHRFMRRTGADSHFPNQAAGAATCSSKHRQAGIYGTPSGRSTCRFDAADPVKLRASASGIDPRRGSGASKAMPPKCLQAVLGNTVSTLTVYAHKL